MSAWSYERPTRTGPYWYRCSPLTLPVVVKVCRFNDQLCAKFDHNQFAVSELDGEWQRVPDPEP